MDSLFKRQSAFSHWTKLLLVTNKIRCQLLPKPQHLDVESTSTTCKSDSSGVVKSEQFPPGPSLSAKLGSPFPKLVVSSEFKSQPCLYGTSLFRKALRDKYHVRSSMLHRSRGFLPLSSSSQPTPKL